TMGEKNGRGPGCRWCGRATADEPLERSVLPSLCAGANLIGANRLGYVLDFLRPEILIGNRADAAAKSGAHRLGNADAAGFCEGLETGRDVYTVPLDIVAVDDDIADVDPDAIPDALVGRA